MAIWLALLGQRRQTAGDWLPGQRGASGKVLLLYPCLALEQGAGVEVLPTDCAAISRRFSGAYSRSWAGRGSGITSGKS